MNIKCMVVALVLAAQLPSVAMDRMERTRQWREDRFGLFIHFGIYAMAARHEKVILREKQSDESYRRYFDNFNPDLFDAREWARTAKAAGMKYAVLTTKHHDGFCLFDSQFTDYKITKTAFGRDLVKEYVEAFRAEGLKVGFYYSVIDWHHPDFTIDTCHPRWQGAAKAKEQNRNRDFSKYRAYMFNQIRELLTNYGKISIVWYDFSYPGENGKGADDWHSQEIVDLTRTLQPGILIDNRLDLGPKSDGWDFVTPEQFKAPTWPTMEGKRVPWETCQTFSGSWGYYRDEHTWKTPAQIVQLLAESASKGGNVMLNVGPTARGTFDRRARTRLAAIGAWMQENGRSIYGCTEAPAGFPVPENTVLTYNPKTNRLYIHLLVYPMGRLPIAFGDRVKYAQFLHDASEIGLREMPKWQKSSCGELTCTRFFEMPMPPPEQMQPVIECMLKD